jgi:hypothetical protein
MHFSTLGSYGLSSTDDDTAAMVASRAFGQYAASTAGEGGVDHVIVHARLGPAHARRIDVITGEGERGLISRAKSL